MILAGNTTTFGFGPRTTFSTLTTSWVSGLLSSAISSSSSDYPPSSSTLTPAAQPLHARTYDTDGYHRHDPDINNKDSNNNPPTASADPDAGLSPDCDQSNHGTAAGGLRGFRHRLSSAGWGAWNRYVGRTV